MAKDIGIDLGTGPAGEGLLWGKIRKEFFRSHDLRYYSGTDVPGERGEGTVSCHRLRSQSGERQDQRRRRGLQGRYPENRGQSIH